MAQGLLWGAQGGRGREEYVEIQLPRTLVVQRWILMDEARIFLLIWCDSVQAKLDTAYCNQGIYESMAKQMVEQGYDQKKNGRRLCHNIMTAGRRDKEKGQEWLFERKKQVEYGYKKTFARAEENKRTAGRGETSTAETCSQTKKYCEM